jgi:rhomboid protease GluP
VLTEPRRSNDQLVAVIKAHEKVGRFNTRPVATMALLAAFLVMFIVELAWTVMPAAGTLTPSIGTLISWARSISIGSPTVSGRMLTCAFLHGGVMHLVFNGIAMYLAGGVLENLVGRAWMLALFVIGALGGSLASMAINPANVTSVGASGAIMGMLAAGMVLALRLPAGPARHQILISLGQILIPSLLPLATHGGDKVDFGAHLGGALAGAAAGGILLLTWARDAERPRAGKVAAAFAAAALLYTGYGLIRVAADHEMYRRAFAGAAFVARNPELVKQLVPDDKMPHGTDAVRSQIAALLESHPRDPRVQFYAGASPSRRSPRRSRTLIDGALADREMLSLLKTPDLFAEVELHYLLGHIHERAGDLPAARAAVLPQLRPRHALWR